MDGQIRSFRVLLHGATKHFPFAFGHLNHSRRLLDGFSPSVVQATRTCFSKYIARLCSGSRYAIIFCLESSTRATSTAEACFQPSMCIRILRGTCLGHFSGVHAWKYTQTKNKWRALQQPLARAKQPLSRAQQQPPALRSRLRGSV